MAIRAKVMANNMVRLFMSLLHKKEQKKSLINFSYLMIRGVLL